MLRTRRRFASCEASRANRSPRTVPARMSRYSPDSLHTEFLATCEGDGTSTTRVQSLHPHVSDMQQVSQGQTLRGVGRLHRGHRNLGCVGYWLQTLNGVTTVVQFDPM